MQPRPFDFVIFGATGFTGKYCVFQAPKHFSGYKWAVAGRSQHKLELMLREIGAELGVDLSVVPIVLADVEDNGSLLEMAKQCRVVINCCGPYVMYGEPVVQACLEAATDYVDVAAEPQFMEKMQLKWHDKAQAKEVYSVSACGFDSILCEMGMIFAEENFQGTLHSTEIYVRVRDDGPLLGATLNYGTWHSMMHVFGKRKQEERDQEKKQVDFSFPEPKIKTKIIHRSTVTKNWYVPFANIDQTVAKRTQMYFQKTLNKHPIQVREYYGLGSTCFIAAIAVFLLGFMYVLTRFEFGVKLVLRYPGFFSLGQVSKQGPNRQKYTTAIFEHTFHNKGWAEGVPMTGKPTHEQVTVVSGTNPAYGATCVCLLFSALMLITEREAIPGR